jgi:natural product biosynthesis luciferase-like monooxygenase protein
VGSSLAALEDERKKLALRFPYPADLPARQPAFPREPLPVGLFVDVELGAELPDRELSVLVSSAAPALELVARSDRSSEAALARLVRRLELFLENARAPGAVLGSVPLVSAEEQRLILDSWNATRREFPEGSCLHELFQAQAARTPDAPAVTAGGRSLTYRELDRRANAIAHELARRGVGADQLVGIHTQRGVHMLAAVIGVHKAGAAYVPLDPRYPEERIRFMAEDARLGVVLTDQASQGALPPGDFQRLLADDPSFDAGADAPPPASVTSENLAYVIYTSGSTGKPKGVMIEHRSAGNFFVAMDDVIRPQQPGTWLAVTSLSFDISVLELLWTVTRGFHVVLHAGNLDAAAPQRRLDFSAFYFSSETAGGGPEHYRLLLEGARFADKHGFVAVWTPERHFHAFGGLYPNPAVTSAALAMVTEHVQLRAGSCVSPLHSPLRIAEEWSLVDNLSNGRAGVSFASGWQPNDFAIRPDSYARRKEQMFEDIETVRRLWRGEKITFKNGTGKEVGVSTLPRPVQKDLPIWVTAAGSPETFEAAGKIGANLLTHLLGQTFKEVGDKVRAYRAAWERAGHPGRGVVSLMLHTFIGHDETAVREAVRKPMKEYLRSAVGLIKDAAWSFPTFKQRIDQGNFSPDQLTPEEMDAVLDFAFERYYATSGLFGTVDSALGIVNQVRSLDVDEIACLIDFGVPADQVLTHLPLLAELYQRANQDANRPASTEATVPELLRQHAATHFQCTPSMASMLVADEAGRAALSRLDTMLVGGEAFPAALAKQLAELVKGSLINVYGPTETTVWSSSQRVSGVDGEVPIGKPLANTEILILDAAGGLVPPNEEGELVIGGKGLARGYLAREELTRERFAPHPLRPGERVYRTGDLACFGDDGVLRFRGRLDHQVKIRGHRIEIGEIETRLGEHAAVRECVVVAREDTPGDKRLVGYVIAKGSAPAPAELKEHLSRSLPEYMIPSVFVFLRTFPQTPNKKIDRKALPAPQAAEPETKKQLEAPKSSLEETIAAIWREVLGRNDVSTTDNFFDLGGHSLLTVQVLGRLKTKVSRPVSLVDLFRYPTIRALAAFLDSAEEAPQSLHGSAERGAERQRIRRAMMERRRPR